MSWLRVMVVKGSNLPSPVISPKPAADPRTHPACWQEKVPPPPRALNLTLETSFSHRSPSLVGALRAASPQPTSDSEHKTCSLPVVGFGAVPRILPGSRLLADSPAPAGKSSNYGSENTAEAPTWSIGAATSPLPHQQPHAVLPTALTSPQGDKHSAVTCHLRNLAAKIKK